MRSLRTLLLICLLALFMGGVCEASQITSPAVTVTNTTTSALGIPSGTYWGEVIYVDVSAIGAGDTWTFKAQYVAPGASAVDLTTTSAGITSTGLTALTLTAPWGVAGATPFPTQIVATRSVNGGTPTITYKIRATGLNAAGSNYVTAQQAAPNEYVVYPNGQVGPGTHATLQAALTAAKANATSTSPVTVRLMPGVYTIAAGQAALSLTSASYVNLVGAGPELTIIRIGAGWEAGATTGANLLDLTSSTHIRLEGIYFDALTNNDISINSLVTAILLDHVDDVIINRCRIEAPVYGTWAQAGDAGSLVEAFDSRFMGADGGIRTGAETWHIFSGSLMAMFGDSNLDVAVSAPLFGIQFGGPTQIWGAHIHCEDMRTTSLGCVAAAIGTFASASIGVEIVGTTLHVKVTNDTDSNSRRFSPLEVNNTGASIGLRVSGCDLILEAPNVTATSATLAQLNIIGSANTHRYEITGNSFKENVSGSGLYRRGTIVNKHASANAPVIRWLANGVGSTINGFTKSAAVNGAVATFETSSIASQRGSATLSSGAKTVLLITDGGAAAGTVTFAASTSVTAGTNLDTIFKPGDFVKNNADGDTAWTRIRAVTATTLTLEENYRGATTGAGQTAKVGTQTTSTQPDGTYSVVVTATTTGETFSITNKHASGFTITSSSGASTATVDWILAR